MGRREELRDRELTEETRFDLSFGFSHIESGGCGDLVVEVVEKKLKSSWFGWKIAVNLCCHFRIESSANDSGVAERKFAETKVVVTRQTGQKVEREWAENGQSDREWAEYGQNMV